MNDNKKLSVVFLGNVETAHFKKRLNRMTSPALAAHHQAKWVAMLVRGQWSRGKLTPIRDSYLSRQEATKFVKRAHQGWLLY